MTKYRIGIDSLGDGKSSINSCENDENYMPVDLATFVKGLRAYGENLYHKAVGEIAGAIDKPDILNKQVRRVFSGFGEAIAKGLPREGAHQ